MVDVPENPEHPGLPCYGFLPLKVDPALGLDEHQTEDVGRALDHMFEKRMVWASSEVESLLVAEVVEAEGDGPHVHVRAATADEEAELFGEDEDGEADDGAAG